MEICICDDVFTGILSCKVAPDSSSEIFVLSENPSNTIVEGIPVIFEIFDGLYVNLMMILHFTDI